MTNIIAVKNGRYVTALNTTTKLFFFREVEPGEQAMSNGRIDHHDNFVLLAPWKSVNEVDSVPSVVAIATASCARIAATEQI